MRSRTGFTLIELMVSMALTLFIMVILSQAFILALDTFSGLKGIGDLQQAMRTAATTLRADLSNYHFDGARRLSDPDIATNPPRQGFFMVYQGRPSFEFDSTTNPTTRLSVSPNTYEGIDPDGVHSYVAVNHVLYFTTRLSGNGYEDFYRTALGTGTAASNVVVTKFLNDFPLDLTAASAADATLTPLPLAGGQPSFGSAWGEICYYLLQTGTTAEPDNPLSTLGTPIYGLYRALYIVPTNSLQINNNAFAAATVVDFQGVSHGPALNNPGFVDFLTPSDLANAQQITTKVVAGNAVNTSRETRTLFMARWNVPGAPFINPLPLVPPSLTWDFSTGLPRIVPRAFTDVNANPAPIPPGGLQVLSNVLSFHVQVMPRPDPRFTVYPYWTDPEPQLSGTSAKGSSVDPNNGDVQSNQARLYDTGAYFDLGTNPPSRIAPPTTPGQATSPPNHTYLYESYPYSVLAVQVTLRVWDPRTQQARQITIVQDM